MIGPWRKVVRDVTCMVLGHDAYWVPAYSYDLNDTDDEREIVGWRYRCFNCNTNLKWKKTL